MERAVTTFKVATTTRAYHTVAPPSSLGAANTSSATAVSSLVTGSACAPETQQAVEASDSEDSFFDEDPFGHMHQAIDGSQNSVICAQGQSPTEDETVPAPSRVSQAEKVRQLLQAAKEDVPRSEDPG